jgi:hypothetical protein
VVIHFLHEDRPWTREHFAMSLLTLALLALMVVRHRKNIVRIAAGTEPKVSFRKKKPPPPAPDQQETSAPEAGSPDAEQAPNADEVEQGSTESTESSAPDADHSATT